jgi:hypothetical protein
MISRYPLAPFTPHVGPVNFALAGLGSGVDQAMANPLIKLGVLALAVYGAATLYGAVSPKPMPRRKNPGRRRRARRKR